MLSLLDLFPGGRIVAYLVIAAALAAGVVFGWTQLTGHYEGIGYKKRRAEDDAAMRVQENRNRELQRTAELHYTVNAQVRERIITNTVTEVRYATQSLAACPVGAAAVRLLNDAAKCAGSDSAAACATGKPVPHS